MLVGSLKVYTIKDEYIFDKCNFKVYNAVSAPMAATSDTLAERLQIVRKVGFLLYNRMMDNIEYGRERLKDIVEKN